MQPDPTGTCPHCGHSWDDHRSTKIRVKAENGMWFAEGFETFESKPGLCAARTWTANGLPKQCGCKAQRPWDHVWV